MEILSAWSCFGLRWVVKGFHRGGNAHIELQGSEQDLLLISTRRYKFCVLGYDSSTGELKTLANGDTRDRVGRPADSGQVRCLFCVFELGSAGSMACGGVFPPLAHDLFAESACRP